MDEARLLMAARMFDQDALKTIFDSYAPVIYKYALRLCHVVIEADNIVGDVFALFLEQLAKGKGPTTNLRAYLFQIAYHVIVDQARDRRHTTQLDVADFHPFLDVQKTFKPHLNGKIKKAEMDISQSLKPKMNGHIKKTYLDINIKL